MSLRPHHDHRIKIAARHAISEEVRVASDAFSFVLQAPSQSVSMIGALFPPTCVMGNYRGVDSALDRGMTGANDGKRGCSAATAGAEAAV